MYRGGQKVQDPTPYIRYRHCKSIADLGNEIILNFIEHPRLGTRGKILLSSASINYRQSCFLGHGHTIHVLEYGVLPRALQRCQCLVVFHGIHFNIISI